MVKSKDDKKWKTKILHATFTNEDRKGRKTLSFAKVKDALGRKLTISESNQLRDAKYNPRIHTVSIKKNKSGKVTFTVKKKKRTGPGGRPPAQSRRE